MASSLGTGQSKKHSLAEALINTAIGYGISVGAQIIIFPFYGCSMSFANNLKLGLAFTVISIARSYLLRRFFNWYHERFHAPIL